MYKSGSTTWLKNQVVLRIFYDLNGFYICLMEAGLYLKEGKIETCDEGIAYWTVKFKCSEKDLREAISKIGTIHNVLLMYLEMNHLIDDE